MIFSRGVPGFGTDCPCLTWCCGLTSSVLYIGHLFKFSWNHSLSVSLTYLNLCFSLLFIIFICIFTYILISCNITKLYVLFALLSFPKEYQLDSPTQRVGNALRISMLWCHHKTQSWTVCTSPGMICRFLWRYAWRNDTHLSGSVVIWGPSQ